MKPVRTRFSPSPTGNMHLGNVRTAFFSLSYSMRKKGNCIIRIEDTDQKRSNISYIRNLFDDLKWLGILKYCLKSNQNSSFQIPQILFQSSREHIYRDYCFELVKNSVAYFCFCSKEDLEQEKKRQILNKTAPRYSGTCRYLTKNQILKKLKNGMIPTVRYLVSTRKIVKFYDIIRGNIDFSGDSIGDFIILKADKKPTFLLCNLVDDMLTGVSHIVRGEDHITNTACQEMISSSLGFEKNLYLHLPLFLEQNSSPFSKRNNSLSIRSLRERGYLSIAILSYISHFGNICRKEFPFSVESLLNDISPEYISKSPIIFNEDQIIHWQKKSVENLCESDFFSWAGKNVTKMVPSGSHSMFFETIRENVLFPNDVEFWSNYLYSSTFTPDYNLLKEFVIDTKLFLEEIKKILLLDEFNLDELVKRISDTFNLKRKIVLMCVRVLLTGRKTGPSLKNILKILGIREISRRLNCENLR